MDIVSVSICILPPGIKTHFHVHLRCLIPNNFFIISLGHEINLIPWWFSLSNKKISPSKIHIANSFPCPFENNNQWKCSIFTWKSLSQNLIQNQVKSILTRSLGFCIYQGLILSFRWGQHTYEKEWLWSSCYQSHFFKASVSKRKASSMNSATYKAKSVKEYQW